MQVDGIHQHNSALLEKLVLPLARPKPKSGAGESMGGDEGFDGAAVVRWSSDEAAVARWSSGATVV